MIVDGLLDTLVVPGFSRIGYLVRSRSSSWESLSSLSMEAKTVVVTGHTSGIGFAAASALRSLNAHLVLIGRDEKRSNEAADKIRAVSGTGTVTVLIADMAELPAVAAAAESILMQCPSVDVLIHNAGALLKTRVRNSANEDTVVASQIFGPHLLTSMLLGRLRESNGRVITVSSGGMYGVPLPFLKEGRSLAMPDDKYDGTKQYAIAKRAQVTLNQIWAEKEPLVHFHAMHPGWADTPGVAEALPGFRKVMSPVLRSSSEGADTIVWLAASPKVASSSGKFWCDRGERPTHRLGSTRKRDTPESRELLWKYVEEHAPHPI